MKAYRILNSLLVSFLAFVGFFHPITALSQDLGRHFLLGEIILKTQNVPKTNLFSYTYPDFPFINLHWLSEVIFYLIFKAGGYDGLLLFSCLIAVSAFFILLLTVSKKSNFIITILSSILYLIILFERTDIRPEIFSFLFMAVFMFVLYKYRERYTRFIFIIPFIELLWVNMHIYFIIGIAIFGLFLFEEIFLKIKNRKKIFNKHTTIQIIVFIITSFLTLLNPNYLKGALYPFYFQQIYGYKIQENQSIFYIWQFNHGPIIIVFFLTAFILFISFAILFKKARLVDFLLYLIFVYLAISSIRNFPLFVFGTFAAFCYNFSILFEKLSQKIKHSFYYILPLITIFFLVFIPQVKGFGFGVDLGIAQGVDFFIKNNLKGPIFNNFDIGSYLDYRLYPKERVFVDNRPGEYPVSFFQKTYIPMQVEEKVFAQVDKKYNFNTIIFSHTDMTEWSTIFLSHIVNNANWQMVYLDDYEVIFVRNNTLNKKVIEKYRINENNFSYPGLNLKNKKTLTRMALFFDKVNWQNKSLQIYQKILELEPDNCLGLYRTAQIYTLKNNPAANIFIARFQHFCR